MDGGMGGEYQRRDGVERERETGSVEVWRRSSSSRYGDAPDSADDATHPKGKEVIIRTLQIRTKAAVQRA